MSKLIDILKKVGEQSHAPMGFSHRASRGDTPTPMALVGQLTAEQLRRDPRLAEASADALLIWMDVWDDTVLDSVQPHLEGRLWGARFGSLGLDQAVCLKERGCDFVFFEAERTEVGVLDLDDLGKVIILEGKLDKDVIRAIGNLSIDAAFFTTDCDTSTMMVSTLMEFAQASALVGKSLVAPVGQNIAAQELLALRHAGIAGLVMNCSPPDVIASTRKALKGLPTHKTRARRKEALVPLGQAGLTGDNSPPDEDEEWDERL